jgi:hypothetical protein
MPKATKTLKLTSLYNKPSFNKLFAPWTTAVDATATGKGKKSAKAGINKVPNPNPENKVRKAVASAVTPITR